MGNGALATGPKLPRPSSTLPRWVPCRSTFFLPVRVLSRLFRRLFLKMLVEAHYANQLKFFGNHANLADRKAFTAFEGPKSIRVQDRCLVGDARSISATQRADAPSPNTLPIQTMGARSRPLRCRRASVTLASEGAPDFDFVAQACLPRLPECRSMSV
jgi:hypothetical protein